MEKKILLWLLVTVYSLVLIGCSLNEGTEELYRQENVLEIEIDLPDDIDANEVFGVQALVTQFDGHVPEVEDIEFFIWKNGEREQKHSYQSNYEGNGLYSMKTRIREEGLYFVKIEANTSESKVMPTKQFIVGSLSEEDSETLPRQNNESHQEGHH
ncbi:FixH family protein [Thalassobacillus sp. C254]|uniref:FixH family protein n=1 Tax=Thalassobacillus sp. C254 TaxID=1225341 RepID=UPI0006D115F4|nr:FixH family protein [Thalassobacillus sp. C254]